MHQRHEAQRRLVGLGMLFSTCLCALLAHAGLGWAQASGILRGDYDSHGHAAVAPVALALLAAGAGLTLLYALHVADAGSRRLPWLARACRRTLGWRAIVALILTTSATLMVMEAGEQLAAHHIDGLLSAFGDEPAIAFGLIAVLSAALVAGQRRLCSWLAGAHAHIVRALVSLLEVGATASAGSFAASQTDDCNAWCECQAPHIFSKRAPPAHLAS